MLERQLRYCDRGRDGRRSTEVARGVVYGCDDLAELFGVCDEHFWPSKLVSSNTLERGC